MKQPLRKKFLLFLISLNVHPPMTPATPYLGILSTTKIFSFVRLFMAVSFVIAKNLETTQS